MNSSEFTFKIMFVHHLSALVIMFSRSYLFFDVWCKIYFLSILYFIFRSRNEAEQNNAKETEIDKAQQSWYFYRHIWFFFLVHYFTLWHATHVRLDWYTFLHLIKTGYKRWYQIHICWLIKTKLNLWSHIMNSFLKGN